MVSFKSNIEWQVVKKSCCAYKHVAWKYIQCIRCQEYSIALPDVFYLLLRLWQAQFCHTVYQDILCIVCLSIWKSKFWFHCWDPQRQKPDDSGMIQSPACWFLWSGWLSCGNIAPAHIVLHLVPWRNHFGKLARAQDKPSNLPSPAQNDRRLPLWGFIWSCQVDPPVAHCQPHCWDHSWK